MGSRNAYRSLTLTAQEVAEHNRLHDAWREATERATLPVAERDMLDAQLTQLGASQQQRDQRRAQETAQRETRATDGDVDGTASAGSALAALDAIDARQAEIAQAVSHRRAELVDRIIPDADAQVQEAHDAVAEWSARHEGKVPRGLVDWVIFQRIRQFIVFGLAEDFEDAESFVADLQFLPGKIAEEVSADPEYFMNLRLPSANSRLDRKQTMSADEARRLLPEIQEALGREDRLNSAKAFGAGAQEFTRGGQEPVYAPFARTREGM